MKTNKIGSPGSPFVGLKDIARKCEVSVMTVSRALRNSGGVSPATREKIIRTAKEMGYVPNLVASNLLSHKTRTVGVVVPDIGVTIFPSVVKGVESVLNRENYRIFLCCTFDSPAKEYQEVQALLRHRVDGIILAPASTLESRDTARKIMASGCPLVFIDRMIPELEVSSVTVGDFEGAYQVTAHMIEQGYRKILHFAGPRNVWTADERLRGYREALREAGLRVGRKDIVRVGFSIDGGMAEMERVLGRKDQPDAIFCVNDPVALGAYQVLRREGVNIPNTMGLAGFSNLLESELLAVPLTSVTHDALTLGQLAARILSGRMSAAGTTERKVVHQELRPQLVVRQSTLRNS
ncbi:LacI family transcriptional regulator [bacterium]|nr:LacI family transcriptional regulator [bacterium]